MARGSKKVINDKEASKRRFWKETLKGVESVPNRRRGPTEKS